VFYIDTALRVAGGHPTPFQPTNGAGPSGVTASGVNAPLWSTPAHRNFHTNHHMEVKMSMTKKLWSISALAVELDKDRRTIANALSGIPPDGHNGRQKAWYLSTAIDALKYEGKPSSHEHPLLDMMVDRVLNWREIRRKGSTAATHITVEDFAKTCDVKSGTILCWLKAGCPFLVAGDWKTGEGFVLCAPYVMEWRVIVSILINGLPYLERIQYRNALDFEW
jgi:hypothetical protein